MTTPVHTKRALRWLCAAMAALALFFCFPILEGSAHANDDVLRLHVIANSDSAADQWVKLEVRDRLLERLPACQSAEQAEAYLLDNGAQILALVEDTLAEYGFQYGAQLMLGTYAFPDRDYGDISYPAGEYNALRILLGDGSGQNWWCVLFPPLCIVTVEQEPLPESDEIEFESSILSWLRGWGESE